jgi:hypothetical protein
MGTRMRCLQVHETERTWLGDACSLKMETPQKLVLLKLFLKMKWNMTFSFSVWADTYHSRLTCYYFYTEMQRADAHQKLDDSPRVAAEHLIRKV